MVANKVFITGLGILLPLEMQYSSLWDQLEAYHLFIRKNPSSPQGEALLIDDARLSLGNLRLDRKLKRFLNHSSNLAIKVVHEALADSGIDLEKLDSKRVGLFVAKKESRFYDHKKYMELLPEGTGRDKTELYTEIVENWSKVMSAIDLLKAIANLESYIISAAYKINGPSLTFLSTEVSGLQAVEYASRYIRQGVIDIAVVCGVNPRLEVLEEARLREMFEEGRFVECGAAVILESDACSQKRDREAYGEVCCAKSYSFPQMENLERVKGIFIKNLKGGLEKEGSGIKQIGLANTGAFIEKRFSETETELVKELIKENKALIVQNFRPGNEYMGEASGLLELLYFALQLSKQKLMDTATFKLPGSVDRDKTMQGFDFRSSFSLVSVFGRDGFGSSVMLKGLG